jgi:hypothetical protein
LAACLIPRAVAAWNWNVLWGDSLHYRYASICLEQGDFQQGFAEFGLNAYPLILIPLRHLGVDWEVAGKYFGVMAASLTVLPLWGWLRRMFDDRLAVIACCIYALHGKLIAISPLIIRDSTFWFLLVLTIYFLWRAVAELRIAFFLAAGLAMTLTVHTRTEGWLLLIPLLGWAARRWSAPHRLRLAMGTLLCLAVIPATVAVVNFTWLRENPRWEFFRVTHLDAAVDWWNSVTGMHLPAPQSGDVPAQNPDVQAIRQLLEARAATGKLAAKAAPFASISVPPCIPPEQATPSWTLTFKLLERLVKGCTWAGGFLLLAGLVCGWRILLRPEHLALLCMNLILILISRIRYWTLGLDLRYFMPIVIVGVPWMALGLQHTIAFVRRLCEQRGELSPRVSNLVVGCLIAVFVAGSLLDGPMSAAVYMRQHAALGRWIYDHAGPEPALAGNLDHLTLETYYSDGHMVGIFWPRDCLLVPLPPAVSERIADVVVLWNEGNIDVHYLPEIERRIAYYGYRRIDAEELPAGKDELMVFVREKGFSLNYGSRPAFSCNK